MHLQVANLGAIFAFFARHSESWKIPVVHQEDTIFVLASGIDAHKPWSLEFTEQSCYLFHVCEVVAWAVRLIHIMAIAIVCHRFTPDDIPVGYETVFI